jgi:hypothetical protein
VTGAQGHSPTSALFTAAVDHESHQARKGAKMRRHRGHTTSVKMAARDMPACKCANVVGSGEHYRPKIETAEPSIAAFWDSDV